ncbi:MAG: energy transducer TonB [Acidobacteriota bacterium]
MKSRDSGTGRGLRPTRTFFAAVLCLAAASAGRGQDFTETRLREGLEAYRAGRPAEAITPLRIAAFGLLDRPRELCYALVYEALAQDAAGRRPEALSIAAKISDFERRVGACGEAPVEPQVREDFNARFRRSPSAAAPAAAPALAHETSRPAPAAPPPPGSAVDPAERPPERTDVDVPPRVSRSFPAVYPRAAREVGLSGTAVIRVLVSDKGRPLRLEPVRGPRPLTEAAIESIRRWEFEPARRDGRDVEAWTVVTVPFTP